MVRIPKVVVALSCCVLLCESLIAQEQPQHLTLVVVEGEGAIHRPGVRAGREPAIRVQDDAGQPVAGVTVVFTLPTDGASGTFGSGSRRVSVISDAQGLAVAQGFRPNAIAGKLGIAVDVTFRGESAHGLITQFILDPSGKQHHGSSGKLITILAIVGGAAAGGAFFAAHRSSSSGPAPLPTITLTPGTTTVGAP